jgi:hypothetical protein
MDLNMRDSVPHNQSAVKAGRRNAGNEKHHHNRRPQLFASHLKVELVADAKRFPVSKRLVELLRCLARWRQEFDLVQAA